MDQYAVRVDIIGYNETHERMQQFLDGLSKYLVYEEVASKTKKLHLQGVVYYDGREKDLRDKWNECFPVDPWEAKVAKKKALAKVRSEKYEIYITKDNNLKYNKNFTEEEINTLYKQSYQKQEEEKEEKVKKPLFREVILQRWAEYYETCRKAHVDMYGNADSLPKRITRRKITQWLIEEFNCMTQLYDTPVLVKYTNLLEYRVDKHRHVEGMLNACEGRY